jgi:hypothetical protein
MLFYVVSDIENGSSSCSVSWRGVLYWGAAKAYLCAMNVYEAIEKMRKLSAAGESFSFTFMSYNSSAGKSDGVVEVRHGMLRARQSTDYNKNAEYMESYIDLDTGEYRQFWQPLLMTFEGEKTILI